MLRQVPQLHIKGGKRLQLLGFHWWLMLLNIWSGQPLIKRMVISRIQMCEMFLSIVEKIHMFSQHCCTIRSMRPIYRILGNSNSNYFLLMMVLEELWNWIIIIHIWSSLLVHERRCHQCWSISIVNGGILAWHVEI
nr:hypothetical protein Iba_chr04dCG10020 [Ipomoea batatas]